MTPLEKFCAKYEKGCGSHLCKNASNICLARGTVPCDILFVGEAPGPCIIGSTPIEVAFRDKRRYPEGIPVKELVGKSGFQVYSYDIAGEGVTIGTVAKVWYVGVKKTYRVDYSWWGAPPDGKGGRYKYHKSIRVTDNHPFLLKSGEYRSIRTGLVKGNRLQPFLRSRGEYPFVGGYSGSMKQESLLLMEYKLGRGLEGDEQVHHVDRNKWNDSWDNLVLTDLVEHARLHGYEDNAMFNPVHRETHRQVTQSQEYRDKLSRRMKDVLASPEARAKRREELKKSKGKISSTLKERYRTDPLFYYRYLKAKRFRNGRAFTDDEIRFKFRCRFPNSVYPPEENHEINYIGSPLHMPVYDLQVDKYHNFATGGIFVHNSEDTIGRPFCGPAGRILDGIMEQVVPKHITYCITNLTGCIPRGEDGAKFSVPDDDDVRKCAPRLMEFTDLCNPKLIVCVGTVARDWLDIKNHHHINLTWTKSGKKREIIDILHPAAILRAPVVHRGLLRQKCVVALQTALEEMGLVKVGEDNA